jgi:hypothetical protein
MAKIKVQDLTGVIQDLSENELDLQGGLCGVLYTIRIGNLVVTTGDKCLRLPPNYSF